MLLIPTLLCPKSWESMSGNEAERFCTHCKKSVHNLEALSASERLALLSSPAASICSRYRVAIRRPAKGQQEAYTRHLLKYGAAVALTGSVLFVLWEIGSPNDPHRTYRMATSKQPPKFPVPEEYFEEHQVYMVGSMATPSTWRLPQQCIKSEIDAQLASTRAHIDLQLDLREIERSILESKLRLAKPGRPETPIQLDSPATEQSRP